MEQMENQRVRLSKRLIKESLTGLLKEAGLAPSVSEARRLIDGGGVKIDQKPVAPKSYNIDPALLHAGVVLQVGKRKYARLA